MKIAIIGGGRPGYFLDVRARVPVPEALREPVQRHRVSPPSSG